MTRTIWVSAPWHCIVFFLDDWIIIFVLFLGHSLFPPTAAFNQTDGGGRRSGGSRHLPRGLLWFCQLIAAPLGSRESTRPAQNIGRDEKKEASSAPKPVTVPLDFSYEDVPRGPFRAIY